MIVSRLSRPIIPDQPARPGPGDKFKQTLMDELRRDIVNSLTRKVPRPADSVPDQPRAEAKAEEPPTRPDNGPAAERPVPEWPAGPWPGQTESAAPSPTGPAPATSADRPGPAERSTPVSRPDPLAQPATRPASNLEARQTADRAAAALTDDGWPVADPVVDLGTTYIDTRLNRPREVSIGERDPDFQGYPAAVPREIDPDFTSPENIAQVPGGSAGDRPASTKPDREEINRLIARAARKNGLSPSLVQAVAVAESSLDPEAVSPAGAIGLMQLMPETARAFGAKDPFDPVQNLEAGCRYLKRLLDRYDGNLSSALAAYNWGPGKLSRHGLDSLPRQTRRFVSRVLGLSAKLAKADLPT